jgi:hypothetical protein
MGKKEVSKSSVIMVDCKWSILEDLAPCVQSVNAVGKSRKALGSATPQIISTEKGLLKDVSDVPLIQVPLIGDTTKFWF